MRSQSDSQGPKTRALNSLLAEELPKDDYTRESCPRWKCSTLNRSPFVTGYRELDKACFCPDLLDGKAKSQCENRRATGLKRFFPTLLDVWLAENIRRDGGRSPGRQPSSRPEPIRPQPPGVDISPWPFYGGIVQVQCRRRA